MLFNSIPVLLFATQQVLAASPCSSNSYVRGVGSIEGGDDKERAGLLYYPKCREGYVGKGPVCWCNWDVRECKEDEIQCGDKCVSINDNNSCGSCHNICQNGYCKNGQCQVN